MQRCDLLKSYKPNFFLTGSLAQILYTRVYDDWNIPIKYQRHPILLADGGTVSIDWAQPHSAPNGRLVVIFPGMGAHSDFGYIKSIAKVLLDGGYEVAVLHIRGVKDHYTSQKFQDLT